MSFETTDRKKLGCCFTSNAHGENCQNGFDSYSFHMVDTKIITLTGGPIPSEYKGVPLTQVAADIIGPSARMISGSKSYYRSQHQRNVVYFNANIFTKEDGKIWYGDIDLTFDEGKLKQLAEKLGKEVFLLSEMSGRFDNEDNLHIKRDAVWSSKEGLMNWLKKNYDEGRYIREDGKLMHKE